MHKQIDTVYPASLVNDEEDGNVNGNILII